MRLNWMLLAVLGLGCAGAKPQVTEAPRATGGMPTKETVYVVPLEEAMAMTRSILEERRYGVFEQENGTVLLTQMFAPGSAPASVRSVERFYVKGERLGPRQSIVRVFRLHYNPFVSGSGGASDIGRG